ncbi:hypothetical protein [Thermoleptolyngbya sp. M55_K2018_002]|uniref:hypothetical protein n=1 Tax=Thermoleptolyngbya sp. M55_K2018_002 TaxID=2747808 RepID=UPI0019E81DC6|nr:hypothetical protein [Thermoleptolyngbya sp. M55_K2018_002]HIK42142.1 hypothetical protein [Thermoleptolyngbya sp. M55_K2018_002]
MSSRFYDPEGLKRVGRIVEEEIRSGRISGRRLAEKAGYSEAAVRDIQKNLKAAPGEVYREPRPDFILAIAPHLTNPKTGQRFDPEELLAIARGLDPSPAPMPSRPYGCAADLLNQAVASHGLDEAAEISTIPRSRLEILLSGTAQPTAGELTLLQALQPLDREWCDALAIAFGGTIEKGGRGKQNGHSTQSKRSKAPRR